MSIQIYEPVKAPSELTADDKVSFYRQMCLIQAFERQLQQFSADGVIRGSLHLCEGQEALPVGACAALRNDDYISVTYRGHGYVICKGCDLNRAMAECAGRSSGLCRGKGGKMHLMDLDHGVMGANGIVGAGVPVAIGGALSAQLSGTDQVAMTVFGDGTINQGVVHESLNLAAIWNLPVIFLCENNLYGEMTPMRDTSPVDFVGERMAAYKIEQVRIDGNDVLAVHEAVYAAAEKGRKGGGPTFIEAMTYRTCGHYNGDPGGYRPEEEIKKWAEQSPLIRFEKILISNKICKKSDIEAARQQAEAAVAAARDFALASPMPAPEELEEDLYI